MAWSFLKRLLAGAPEPRVVTKRIEDVHVSPVGAAKNDPKAVELAHEFEEALKGSHDPAEMAARRERFEREHGMKELSHEGYVLQPDLKTALRQGEEGMRRRLEELQHSLEGVDDPAERKARMERFAQENGWKLVPKPPRGL